MNVLEFQIECGLSDLAIRDLKAKHYSCKYQRFSVFSFYFWGNYLEGFYKTFSIDFNTDFVKFLYYCDYFL